MYGNLSVQQNPAAEAHVQSDQRAKQARQLIVTWLYLGLVTLLFAATNRGAKQNHRRLYLPRYAASDISERAFF